MTSDLPSDFPFHLARRNTITESQILSRVATYSYGIYSYTRVSVYLEVIMPLAVFVTNVDMSSTMEEFATGLTHILSDRLHREEETITVHIQPNQFMLRGGSTDPAGYVSLCTSRGFGDIDHRRETSQKVLDHIKEQLKLKDSSRFMVYMHTMSADDIGIDGGLVSDRFGCMGQGGPFDVRWHKLTK